MRRACRGARRGSRRQAQVRQYPGDQRRLLDGGDDPALTATLRAVFEVDFEHALEPLDAKQVDAGRSASAMKFFFDTNVLVYPFDADSPGKRKLMRPRMPRKQWENSRNFRW